MSENNQNRDLLIKISCIVSSILQKWKTILFVVLLFGIVIDVGKTLQYEPKYVSSLSASLGGQENTYSQLEEVRAYIKTLDYISNGQVVNDYIKEKMKVKNLPVQFHVSSANDTNMVTIQAISNTKENAYESLKYFVEWYEKEGKNYYFTYDLNVLNKTPVSEAPMNINSHKKNFVSGGVLGGVLAIAICFLAVYFKDTIKTASDIQNKIDCRLFVKIPKERKKRGKKFWKKNRKAVLITSLKTSFQYKEAIKKLRSRVVESAKKHDYKTIMVTSALENEGKSSIAVNLSLALVKSGYKLLIIDGDIRKPSLHKIININSQKNMNAYLHGEEDWKKQVEHVKKYTLDVLLAKQDLKEAERLVTQNKIKQLLEEAKQEYDFVIIDSSPVYNINEPLVISEQTDAVLLVIKQNLATVKIVNETISRLVSVKNNLIGSIFNGSVIDLSQEQKTYGYRYRYNRYQTEGRRRG